MIKPEQKMKQNFENGEASNKDVWSWSERLQVSFLL